MSSYVTRKTKGNTDGLYVIALECLYIGDCTHYPQDTSG